MSRRAIVKRAKLRRSRALPKYEVRYPDGTIYNRMTGKPAMAGEFKNGQVIDVLSLYPPAAHTFDLSGHRYPFRTPEITIQPISEMKQEQKDQRFSPVITLDFRGHSHD